MQSKSNNSVGFRLRPDLEVHPQRSRKRCTWVIKDPLAMRYFQFKEDEYAVMQLLDGALDIAALKNKFEAMFVPRRISIQQLQSFITNLHRNNLLLSNGNNQADEILVRYNRNRRQFWLSMLTNPLAIRLRGFNPQYLLDRIFSKRHPFTSPVSLAFSLVLIFAALWLLLINQEQLADRLPQMSAFLSPTNLLWLSVALAITKILHELGHAIACKHFGAECHEMGIMLLVFTPCLYCNVSDSWKLSNRWQRIAIAAAGIYVEFLLAAIATLIWWFTQPGLLHSLSLNIMVVCSIGTIFLNGNPLLRYDGYYILSDLIDVPNLWQQSMSEGGRFITRCFAGFDPGNPFKLDNNSNLGLLTFAILSATYRIILIATIIYFLFKSLSPIGLSVIASLVAVLACVGIVSVPIRAMWKGLSNPIVRSRIRQRNLFISSAICMILGAVFLFLPLPCKLVAPCEIQPANPANVYVHVSGRLLHAVQPGEAVSAGDVLARLENRVIKKQWEKVEGKRKIQQTRVKSLEALRGRSRELGNELPTARSILEDLTEQASKLKGQIDSLTLVAPMDGIVLPPPILNQPDTEDEAALKWDGIPLDPENLGCILEKQTLLCSITNPTRFQAVLTVEENDIQFIRLEQNVKLKLSMLEDKILAGVVTDISQKGIDLTPHQVDNPDAMQIGPEKTRFQQARTYYQVEVQLNEASRRSQLLVGAHGHARIQVEPQSMGQRVTRFLTSTFKPVD
ncbi:MAG: site-2 protease family protein [Rubripirellula sp.]